MAAALPILIALGFFSWVIALGGLSSLQYNMNTVNCPAQVADPESQVTSRKLGFSQLSDVGSIFARPVLGSGSDSPSRLLQRRQAASHCTIMSGGRSACRL
jgi:hypothetical protein